MLIVLFLTTLPAVVVAADWPHLRGPNFDAISLEIGLAETWGAEGPPRRWARELGQGYSGFVAGDGKLYTQRHTLGGQFLLCLDPLTGQTIWEYRYDWAWQPKGAYPGPYASPTWYRGKVFYASTTGTVGCIDAASGAPVWSFNLRARFQGKGWDFGYAATPLVEDGKVILPVGGVNASLVALDVDDGRTVWTAGSDPASYCPAFPFTFEGRRCVAGYLQNAIILVELATGKLLHRQAISNGYDEHSAWPVYEAPHLWFANPFRVPSVCYELTRGTGEAIVCKPHWISKEMSNDIVSSVLHQGHLYGFDLRQLQASPNRASRGAFRCVDWASGKVAWSTEAVGQAAVLVADGKLFLLNDTGTLILAEADAREYQELGRTQLFTGETCWTPPMIWNGHLYARSPSQAICLYVGRKNTVADIETKVSTKLATWRIEPSWFLTREREFPNDAPTVEEMALWYLAGLILAFGGAAIGAGIWRVATGRFPGAGSYFGAVFVLGFLGPNVFSSLADTCLFTWPAALYAVFHATVLAYGLAGRSTEPRSRWSARLMLLLFLCTCWGYYELCKSVGMFIAWSFLIGFTFAFPWTCFAVYAQMAQQRLWVVAVWTLLAFTAFFWSCQVFFLWKTAQVIG